MNLTPIDKVVCIDFDDTIISWENSSKGSTEVFPGVPEALRRLWYAGYKIVILTSRMSEEWFDHFAEFGYSNPSDFARDQLGYIMEVLNDNEIHWDKITAEKIPAKIYFDDKAVNVTPGDLAYTISTFLDFGLL